MIVPDGQRALEDLGTFARKQHGRATFVAVTGSAGKTTTKEALATVLSQCQGTAVYKSPGNFNNHIGVPFSLANMPLGVTHAVLEMGMSHSGEIRHLTSLVRPHIALITTVGLAHAEAFKTPEDIARAPIDLFPCFVPQQWPEVYRQGPN